MDLLVISTINFSRTTYFDEHDDRPELDFNRHDSHITTCWCSPKLSEIILAT